jgi:predicted amidohydrolase
MNASKDHFWGLAAAGIGLAVSTGYPAGIIAAAGMPVVCLMPKTRRLAFAAALAYYAAALAPIVPTFERYFGRSYVSLFALWTIAATLLSLPWMLAWTLKAGEYVWRVPLAVIASAVPPLGIIGFASPLTAAGYVFPGMDWAGLAAIVILPGIFVSAESARSRLILMSLVGVLCAGSHVLDSRGHLDSPRWWVAVDTHLGDLSKPFRDFAAAEFIQQEAKQSTARVLIFPEAVVPRWSEATAAFWNQTLVRCRQRGQILVIGAGLPVSRKSTNAEKWNRLPSWDFQAALDSLKGASTPGIHTTAPSPHERIDNAVILVGADSKLFYQRVPVPIGMWNPFDHTSVPLRLDSPGVIDIDHQRAAILICYEQMIPFPVLASMLQHPTVIVGISNTFWVSGTSIPRYQTNVVWGWARLFGLPYLLAANS